MAVRMKDVRAVLEPDEPKYAQAVQQLGAEALPHLEKLIEGDDPNLASKAASLAGMIQHEGAAAVLGKAAQSDDPRVRVAAAAATRHQSDQVASQILIQLMHDEDTGVCAVALKSLPRKPSADLRSALSHVAKASGIEPSVQQLATQVLQRMETSGQATAPGSGEMPTGRMDEMGTREHPISRKTKDSPSHIAPQTPPGEMPTGKMDELESGSSKTLRNNTIPDDMDDSHDHARGEMPGGAMPGEE